MSNLTQEIWGQWTGRKDLFDNGQNMFKQWHETDLEKYNSNGENKYVHQKVQSSQPWDFTWIKARFQIKFFSVHIHKHTDDVIIFWVSKQDIFGINI